MPLVGGVVVTHGNLAAELVSAAETIVGDIRHITAVSIGWHDEVETAREEIGRAIKRVDAGAGVLVLTDMFGGTPTNLACTFLGEAPIEVVTGVNLPMIIKLAEQQSDETLASWRNAFAIRGRRIFTSRAKCSRQEGCKGE